MQRTLIIGSKGMLARALREVLTAQRVEWEGVDLPECDITRIESVQAAFEQHRPSVVYNCAAFTRVDACETEESLATAVNATGVGNLAEVCRDQGAKLVHVSTDFVFDGSAKQPYRPDDTPSPLSAYGRTKLRGEQLLREVNPTGWIIARTAWLYGSGGANFPRTMVERARGGHPLRVVNDQWGSPTYTMDLAAALVELVAKDAAGIFHATNSGQTNWHEFAATALAAFGVSTDLQPTSTAEYLRARPNQAHRPAYSVLDCNSLTAALGRPMRVWHDALRDFAARVQRDGSF